MAEMTSSLTRATALAERVERRADGSGGSSSAASSAMRVFAPLRDRLTRGARLLCEIDPTVEPAPASSSIGIMLFAPPYTVSRKAPGLHRQCRRSAVRQACAELPSAARAQRRGSCHHCAARARRARPPAPVELRRPPSAPCMAIRAAAGQGRRGRRRHFGANAPRLPGPRRRARRRGARSALAEAFGPFEKKRHAPRRPPPRRPPAHGVPLSLAELTPSSALRAAARARRPRERDAQPLRPADGERPRLPAPRGDEEPRAAKRCEVEFYEWYMRARQVLARRPRRGDASKLVTREETSATCSSVGLWRRRAAGLAEGGVASCVATDSSRSSHCICGVIEPGVAPRAASSSTPPASSAWAPRRATAAAARLPVTAPAPERAAAAPAPMTAPAPAAKKSSPAPIRERNPRRGARRRRAAAPSRSRRPTLAASPPRPAATAARRRRANAARARTCRGRTRCSRAVWRAEGRRRHRGRG